MKINSKSTISIFLGAIVIIISLSMGCKKSKDEPAIEKKEITVVATRAEMLVLPGIIKPDAMGIVFNYNGVEKAIDVSRTDTPGDVNGTIDLSNTDIVSTNSTIVSFNSNETIVLKNLNIPITIVVTLKDDPAFTKITVQFDANTQFYFSDMANKDAYFTNRPLLMTNVKKIADFYDSQTLFLVFRVKDV